VVCGGILSHFYRYEFYFAFIIIIIIIFATTLFLVGLAVSIILVLSMSIAIDKRKRACRAHMYPTQFMNTYLLFNVSVFFVGYLTNPET
jgi:hypothetical protein